MRFCFLPFTRLTIVPEHLISFSTPRSIVVMAAEVYKKQSEHQFALTVNLGTLEMVSR